MDDIQQLQAELSTQRLLLQELYKCLLFRQPETRDEIKKNLLEGLHSVADITTPSLRAAPRKDVLLAIQGHIEEFFADVDQDLLNFEQLPARCEPDV